MPIGHKLDRIFFRCKGVLPMEADLDILMNEIVRMIKKYERSIPISKFKSNIKPFWCEQLH